MHTLPFRRVYPLIWSLLIHSWIQRQQIGTMSSFEMVTSKLPLGEILYRYVSSSHFFRGHFALGWLQMLRQYHPQTLCPKEQVEGRWWPCGWFSDGQIPPPKICEPQPVETDLIYPELSHKNSVVYLTFRRLLQPAFFDGFRQRNQKTMFPKCSLSVSRILH